MQNTPEATWLAVLFLLVALVYASVGQAGASGYIAVMGFFGMAPIAMKITALALNLLVATIGTVQFWRAGRLSWRAVYPFAVLGFPFSLLGGAVHLPTRIYYPVVGTVLVLSALIMARSALRRGAASQAVTPAPFMPALLVGAAIGFVSGTTGTGGGVFLAPVILAMKWGSARQTATTTAVYNLMNSAAALLGAHGSWQSVPHALPHGLLAVGAGGSVGAFVGSRYLPDHWLRAILATLLMMAGIRLLFG